MKRKDGGWVWVHNRWQVITCGGGAVALLHTINDILELSKIEADGQLQSVFARQPGKTC